MPSPILRFYEGVLRWITRVDSSVSSKELEQPAIPSTQTADISFQHFVHSHPDKLAGWMALSNSKSAKTSGTDNLDGWLHTAANIRHSLTRDTELAASEVVHNSIQN